MIYVKRTIFLLRFDFMSIILLSSSFSGSLQDSSHGASYRTDEGMTPLDQQPKLFGALNFPVTSETEAWKEKVSTIVLVYISL